MPKPDLTQFDTILDANDPNFAKKFADAIGLKEGDSATFITPQFTRPKNEPAPSTAPTPEEFAQLHTLSDEALFALGLRRWNKVGDPEDGDRFKGGQLWLIPGEWYAQIPVGFELTDIMGMPEKFTPGESDDDIRCGCLAYGIVKLP